MAAPRLSKLHLHLLEYLTKNATTKEQVDVTPIATANALTTYRIMAEMDLTSSMCTEDFVCLAVATWKLLEHTYQDLEAATRCATDDIIRMHLKMALSMGRVSSS
jgi:hypothetical protein